jgi:hypothetical protein
MSDEVGRIAAKLVHDIDDVSRVSRPAVGAGTGVLTETAATKIDADDMMARPGELLGEHVETGGVGTQPGDAERERSPSAVVTHAQPAAGHLQVVFGNAGHGEREMRTRRAHLPRCCLQRHCRGDAG